MPANPTCPKCGRSMEEGFLADESHGAVKPSRWVGGPPEKSFWQGTKTRGKPKFGVTTFRCSGCGYLESYAREA